MLEHRTYVLLMRPYVRSVELGGGREITWNSGAACVWMRVRVLVLSHRSLVLRFKQSTLHGSCHSEAVCIWDIN